MADDSSPPAPDGSSPHTPVSDDSGLVEWLLGCDGAGEYLVELEPSGFVHATSADTEAHYSAALSELVSPADALQLHFLTRLSPQSVERIEVAYA